MLSLTKENFWNGLMERYPEGTKHFCEWIDKYKEEVGWNKLFGEGIKFHDLPIDMQYGIIARFDSEKHNGKEGADRIRGNIPNEVTSLINEVHTLILMNKQRKNN